MSNLAEDRFFAVWVGKKTEKTHVYHDSFWEQKAI